MTVDQFSLQAK